MSPNIRIAFRFLIAKKRSMVMSLSGIIFGVGFFIAMQAQLSGYQELFINTILGAEGAIRIEDQLRDLPVMLNASSSGRAVTDFAITNRDNLRFEEGIEYPAQVMEALRELPNVKAASSVVKGNAQLQSPLRKGEGQVYGIVLDDHAAVSNLVDQVKFGSAEAFSMDPMGVVMGWKMAARLSVEVGDSIIIRSIGQQERYKVSAIFETGVSEIDKTRVFMHMSAARSLLQQPFGVTFIQVSVFDRDQAIADAAAIERMTSHYAAAWQKREKSWLQLFKTLKLSGAITVSTLIIVSGLGMFSTLFMIVMDKTREIAILRSMGFTQGDISSIFLWQGAMVLMAGTALGCCMGALITYGISSLPMPLSGIFATEYFVVNWSIWHYVQAVSAACVIVIVASLAPARRAARLVPGEVIRGTAG